MGATVTETNEELAERLEREQNELDQGGDEPSLRSQVDAEREKLEQDAALDQVMQGNLSGGWEAVIGGKAPTAQKQRFVGGAIVMDPPAGGWKKGQTLKVELTVRAGGVDLTDVVDTETGQAIDCNQTMKLRVLGGRVVEVVEEVE